MAAVTAYANIVEQVLDVYTKIPYAHGDLTCEAIYDRPRNRFVLMTIGWDDDERVHHPLAHIDSRTVSIPLGQKENFTGPPITPAIADTHLTMSQRLPSSVG